MNKIIPAREGFLFGCDPELFVTNPEGKIVPACDFVPGNKDCPFPVEGGAVQVDGLAAEFNITPAHSFEEFNQNIVRVVKQLKDMLPAGYGLSVVSHTDFDPEDLERVSPSALELGCNPDFDAWTGNVNMPPDVSDRPTFRTAAGHLHIGWCENADLNDIHHLQNCSDLVQQLDYFLGAWSVLVDKEGGPRRLLYGKAGACRFKPYGVEYRVLSNFWIADKRLRLTVWNRMNAAINRMSSKFFPQLAERFNPDLITAINTNSVDCLPPLKYPIRQIAEAYISY